MCFLQFCQTLCFFFFRLEDPRQRLQTPLQRLWKGTSPGREIGSFSQPRVNRASSALFPKSRLLWDLSKLRFRSGCGGAPGWGPQRFWEVPAIFRRFLSNAKRALLLGRCVRKVHSKGCWMVLSLALECQFGCFAFWNWFLYSGNVCSTDVMLAIGFLHALIECKARALLLGKVTLRGKYLVRALCFFFWMQNSAETFVVVVFFPIPVRDTTWASLFFSAERWRIVQPCFIHFQTRRETKLDQIEQRLKFRLLPHADFVFFFYLSMSCLHLNGGHSTAVTHL